MTNITKFFVWVLSASANTSHAIWNPGLQDALTYWDKGPRWSVALCGRKPPKRGWRYIGTYPKCRKCTELVKP